ncbi:RNA-binding protein [Psychromonas sp. MME2]|uniref:RNA recognition motif domain-containing protein n=1 Tax=Psychromonas sp. MME2 TaxID=3231033 RepID=UPI00339CF263
MKSNTSVLLSVAVAILGFIVISVSGINIPGQYLFVIGALATGLAIQFIPTTKSTNTSEEANTADFTTATLYVGNLPYRANEMAIRTLFSEHGKVISVRLMKDKHTGKRRGFGFVEMPEEDAKNAIAALNEYEFQDRSLKVREANERAPRNDDNSEN